LRLTKSAAAKFHPNKVSLPCTAGKVEKVGHLGLEKWDRKWDIIGGTVAPCANAPKNTCCPSHAPGLFVAARLCVTDSAYCVKIHNMDSAKLIKRLKADDWFLVGVVGSHHHFKHADKLGKVTVPHPRKDLAIGTMRSILKQAGLS